MAKFSLTPMKTYKTEANADRAVRRIYPKIEEYQELRYMVVWNEEGRCYPLFIGQEAALHGVHFFFCVAS